MHAFAKSTLAIAFVLCAVVPARAQRFSFEKSFEVSDVSVLKVSTIRGQIDVTAGEPGRLIVGGAVTVRIGWNVPANAADLARKVADHPPIAQERETIRLSPPADLAERQAVTVSYEVRVPPNTRVLTVSESGATTVRDVTGPVAVRTQSGAITLGRLGGTVTITTGSGAVMVDGALGTLTVTTSSSVFTGRAIQSDMRVRTKSGQVDVELTGAGDVDIETGSSAIAVRGVRAALRAATQSGRVSVQGIPGDTWNASTGSGSVDFSIAAPDFTLDAASGSGSVGVEGVTIEGVSTKRKVAGTAGGGGPLVRIASRSGAIRLTVTAADRHSSPPPVR